MRTELGTLLVAAACLAAPLGAQQARPALTLQQAIDLAQRSGLAAKAAVNTRDAARSRERSFNARRLRARAEIAR